MKPGPVTVSSEFERQRPELRCGQLPQAIADDAQFRHVPGDPLFLGVWARDPLPRVRILDEALPVPDDAAAEDPICRNPPGRERTELVTDDKAALREQLEAVTGERIVALEAVDPEG